MVGSKYVWVREIPPTKAIFLCEGELLTNALILEGRKGDEGAIAFKVQALCPKSLIRDNYFLSLGQDSFKEVVDYGGQRVF